MGFALHSKANSDAYDDESVAIQFDDVTHFSDVHAFGWNKVVST